MSAMVNVVICRARQFPLRRILACPTCKQRRRFAVLDEAWYGPTVTCCHCGDSWSDGELSPRPARRGWRAEAAAKAKETWIEAGQYTKDDHKRWLREEYGEPAEQTEDKPTA